MNDINNMKAIVWFKKDLRLFDNQAISVASQSKSVLPIYVFEPSIWSYGDLSKRHFQFVLESLVDLKESLTRIGSDLYVTIDEIENVLNELYLMYGEFVLYSHREHGLSNTYIRDKKVKKWIIDHQCKWIEFSSFSVARYPNEYPRYKFKEKFLSENIYPIPNKLELPNIIPNCLSSNLQSVENFKVSGNSAINPLKGGEKEAIIRANDFFKHRFKKYNIYINKPYYSILSSSLIAPYLTWGNISLKALQRATNKHMNEQQKLSEFNFSQLFEFNKRIQMHCSFVQAIENDQLLNEVARDNIFDEVKNRDKIKLEAFKNGKTGIPFVDACMISLNEKGWINFKQRAMLASFACNTLLLDWKEVGTILANLWLDYEPGIHWLQIQTQAGLIPYRHIPLYDVIKQSKMHDPEGLFIKKYIPELASVSDDFIHEPWLLDNNPYISPIINYRETFNYTKDLLYKIKKSNGK